MAKMQTKNQHPDAISKIDSSDSWFDKSICSSTDCTGLIPALPSSEAELEAYEEMYEFCKTDAADHNPQTPPVS